ncbi:MAG: CIA30 family protein, partial [Phormidesmis sp.]
MKKKTVVVGDRASNLFDSLQKQCPPSIELIRYWRDRPSDERAVSTNDAAAQLKPLVRSADTVIVLEPSHPSQVTDIAAYLKAASDVSQSVFDFSEAKSDLSAWGALDDVVMGGVSQGSFFLRRSAQQANGSPTQAAVFAGEVST